MYSVTKLYRTWENTACVIYVRWAYQVGKDVPSSLEWAYSASIVHISWAHKYDSPRIFTLVRLLDVRSDRNPLLLSSPAWYNKAMTDNFQSSAHTHWASPMLLITLEITFHARIGRWAYRRICIFLYYFTHQKDVHADIWSRNVQSVLRIQYEGARCCSTTCHTQLLLTHAYDRRRRICERWDCFNVMKTLQLCTSCILSSRIYKEVWLQDWSVTIRQRHCHSANSHRTRAFIRSCIKQKHSVGIYGMEPSVQRIWS